MHNALIVTPKTFKQQLIWRICFLLTRQPGQRFQLDEPLDMIGVSCVAIYSKKGRELILELVAEDGIEFEAEAHEVYIENLWDIYLACEPIYQQRIVDYANFEG